VSYKALISVYATRTPAGTYYTLALGDENASYRLGGPKMTQDTKVLHVFPVKISELLTETLSLFPTRALHDVVQERARQVAVEGRTVEADDKNDSGQMAVAAGYYALASGWPYSHNRSGDQTMESPPQHWPWAAEWWKPRTARENLVRAGALIIAEIERLDRAAPPDEDEDA